MFERHKAKKAEEEYEAQLSTWQAQHDELTAVLQSAKSRQGYESSDLVLKPGETIFGTVAKASLIEDRRGPGQYTGGSAGVSIPLGSVGGHSVRYRVGATRGHYVQGTPHPEAVDQGELVVTNQRAVWVGGTKTIECLFSKLVNVTVGDGEVALSVSNREKVTRVHYGPQLDAWVHLRLTLALSVFRGDADQFAEQVQEQLTELESKRPVQPQATRGTA
jgi:hypothetical protein